MHLPKIPEPLAPLIIAVAVVLSLMLAHAYDLGTAASSITGGVVAGLVTHLLRRGR